MVLVCLREPVGEAHEIVGVDVLVVRPGRECAGCAVEPAEPVALQEHHRARSLAAGGREVVADAEIAAHDLQPHASWEWRRIAPASCGCRAAYRRPGRYGRCAGRAAARTQAAADEQPEIGLDRLGSDLALSIDRIIDMMASTDHRLHVYWSAPRPAGFNGGRPRMLNDGSQNGRPRHLRRPVAIAIVCHGPAQQPRRRR